MFDLDLWWFEWSLRVGETGASVALALAVVSAGLFAVCAALWLRFKMLQAIFGLMRPVVVTPGSWMPWLFAMALMMAVLAFR